MPLNLRIYTIMNFLAVRSTMRKTSPRARVRAPAIDEVRANGMRRTVILLMAGLLVAGMMASLPNRAQAATAPENAAASSVFNMLNAERKANRLPALGWSTSLVASARRHNLTMASKNTLSHQLPPEAAPGTRIRAVGVAWHSFAENIAYTTNRTTAGANQMQQLMYGERAPNNGHRLNILSTSVRAVGIDVLIDARTGKLWLTEDFADVSGVAPVSHVPGGHLDSVRVLAGHRVTLTGWAVDPDNRSMPLRIAIYSDGRGVGTFASGVGRPSVARAVHAGPNQGFQITVRLAAGWHGVCTYALNIGAGGNRLIRCVTVRV